MKEKNQKKEEGQVLVLDTELSFYFDDFQKILYVVNLNRFERQIGSK